MNAAHERHPIAQPEDVGDARRAMARAADRAGLPADVRDRAAAAVTELGTNLLRHADPGGYLLVRAGCTGVEVLAVDTGPGIDDPAAALRGGLAPDVTPIRAGGLGVGLGAVQRTAQVFDMHTHRDTGTVIFAAYGSPHSTPDLVSGISVAKLQGDACGDRWSARVTDRDIRLLVVDGLGHGAEAATAADAAVNAFEQWRTDDPRDAVLSAHRSMLGTRGGVLTVCRLDPMDRIMHAAGVGNITVRLTGPGVRTGLLSPPGTVGTVVRAPQVRPETVPWPRGARVIMFSDGLNSSTDVDRPDLIARHPAVIAAVLHRDHARGTDDATVLVCCDAA